MKKILGSSPTPWGRRDAMMDGEGIPAGMLADGSRTQLWDRDCERSLS
jgi:hypothetical protein